MHFVSLFAANRKVEYPYHLPLPSAYLFPVPNEILFADRQFLPRFEAYSTAQAGVLKFLWQCQHTLPEKALTAPSPEAFSSGITNLGSTSIIRPKPLHLGQAPTEELKEKADGVGGLNSFVNGRAETS